MKNFKRFSRATTKNMTKNRTNTIYRISDRPNTPLYLEFAEEEAKLIRDGNVIFTKASTF